MIGRLIDPTQHNERAVDEQHGVVTQRELSRQIDQGRKTDAELSRTQQIILPESIEVHCPNPVANTADQTMFHLVATGTTTMTLAGLAPRVSQQCRITHLRLLSSNYVTAGTIVPLIEITEPDGSASVKYTFSECQLDTGLDDYGNPIASKSAFFQWDVAIQLAKGETWVLRLTTSAGYLPITNDYKAIITFSVGDWI